MRRHLATLGLALVLAAALVVPAHGAASTQKLAFGSWAVPTNDPDRFTWYFAAGMTDLHAGESEMSWASVGKGSCVRKKTRRSVSVSCSARSGPSSEDPSSFVMDEAATEAQIRIEERGTIHTAQISTGDFTDDGIFTSQMACENGGGAGGGIYRNSEAAARLFGRKLTAKTWLDFSVLMSGAGVSHCPRAVDLFTDLAAGEEIRLTFVKS